MRRTLPEHLTALDVMSAAELSKEWERVYGTPAPHLSADLLRLGVAWRVQEKKLGGLSRNARLVLKSSAGASEARATPRRKLTPGTRLVRDWHGIGHTVTVLDSGFEYAQRRWSSLTSIARHITGAQWSGPRFFGLTGEAS